MTIRMTKKGYILTEGTELDAQSFFIAFGFKTRAFAESEFKQAVLHAHQETPNPELRTFLEEEFLNNNFKMLTESRHLNIYWSDTAKEVVSLNSLNADNYFQLPVLHDRTNQAIEAITIKSMTNYRRYTKSLSYQKQSPEEVLYLYKVISTIMNAHYTHPSLFNLSSPEEYSEQDISNIIWAPVFDALFANTPIIVKSGETVFRDSGKIYKIDSPLGIKINGKFVDIANVEVGKEVETAKIKDDHHKVVLEATTIIRRIITSFYFINPASLTIFSLQICRLKGDLLYTRLLEPSKYRTERACSRFQVPLKPTDTNGMKMFLRTLLLFRDQVEEAASGVKDDVINAINTRRSFGPVLEHSYKDNLPRYTSWIVK